MNTLTGKGVRSVLYNTSYIFSSQLLTIIVRASYILLVARILKPEIYGLFVTIQSWYIAFLPLSVFGMQGIISLELAKNKTYAQQFAGSSLSLRFITACSSSLLCILLGWFLNESQDVRKLILLFSIAMLGRSLAAWNNDIFTAYERAQTNLYLEVIFRPLEALIGSGWILFANGGIIEIALVHTISWWMQALLGFWLVKKNFVSDLKPVWDSILIKRMLTMAIPLLISGLAINWFLQGPVVLLKYASLPEQTIGYLALAFQIFSLVCAIPFSLGTAALPVLSRATQRNDGKDIIFAETTIKGMLLLAAPAGIASIYIMPLVTPWVFGLAYSAAGELLGWTLWLLIPFSIGYLLCQVLTAQKQLKLAGLSALSGVIVFSSSYIYLIDMYGANGSIISCALGMITWALLSIVILIFISKLNIIQTLILPLTGFGLVLFGSFYIGIL